MSNPSDELVLEGDLKDLFKNMRLNVHETARSVHFCFACQTLLPIEDDATVILEVLRGRPPACPKGNAAVDVWKNIVSALTLGGLALATKARVIRPEPSPTPTRALYVVVAV